MTAAEQSPDPPKRKIGFKVEEKKAVDRITRH